MLCLISEDKGVHFPPNSHDKIIHNHRARSPVSRRQTCKYAMKKKIRGRERGKKSSLCLITEPEMDFCLGAGLEINQENLRFMTPRMEMTAHKSKFPH